MAAVAKLNLGKYREIVLAVAFFLVFDLAVLVLNFVISFQISEDALAINLAGRQRMLSQRMSKTVFDLRHETRADSLKELQDTAGLFEKTLLAFENGGQTSGGNGNPVILKAASGEAAGKALASARSSWEAIRPAINALIADGKDPALRETASHLIRQHNPILLKEMNALTSALEAEAGGKANRLRMIQTGGILLALGNFMFILFKFIRRLRMSDAATEAAQKETQEILSTVREGLALVDKDIRLGAQQSGSFARILGVDASPGTSLLDVLEGLVDRTTHTAAREYLDLLLAGRVKESLVEYLNPLSRVTVGSGKARRHLSFQFNRVTSGNQLSHLLVTVLDISEQVRLEEALEEAHRNSEKDLDLMLRIASAHPEALSRYLGDAERELLTINDELRELGRRRDPRIIHRVGRRVHALKSEAAALDLPFFVTLAHHLEDPLIALRRDDLASDEAESKLLSLPIALEAFLQRLAQVRELTSNLHRFERLTAQMPEFPATLETLCNTVAQRQGKLARLQLELVDVNTLPARLRAPIREIAQQLLRNAVVHGIETSESRITRQKSAAGLVEIALSQDGDDWILRCRDDGAGIDTDKLRSNLLSKGVMPTDEIEAMSPQQLVQTIFMPGISTAGSSDEDAGRGIGLDLVRHEVAKHGGRLRLQSCPGQFTEFSIRFEG